MSVLTEAALRHDDRAPGTALVAWARRLARARRDVGRLRSRIAGLWRIDSSDFDFADAYAL